MSTDFGKFKIEHPVNRCIAKTRGGTRCCRKPVKGHCLCFQHKPSLDLLEKRLMNQHGGDPLVDAYKSLFSVALPSCLDVISCDWITDVTYAIPGLSSLIKLMSL
jgi:hypothetical protein